jgi:Tfp pilus assembly protein PilV
MRWKKNATRLWEPPQKPGGFTRVELLIALLVLTVGLLAECAQLFSIREISSGNTNSSLFTYERMEGLMNRSPNDPLLMMSTFNNRYHFSY